MNFLPQSYKAPASGGSYMKLQDGENKFRILSAPILGWEDWEDKRPIRYRYADKPEVSIDPAKPAKHFWAMIVWNYKEESIQILQVTQTSIRKAIETLCSDSDWGAPYHYDIKIVKSGTNKETKYAINPLPHKPVAPGIEAAFKAKPICLEALFDGRDPFSSLPATPGVFSSASNVVSTPSVPEGVISPETAARMYAQLKQCSQEYQASIAKFCANNGVKENLEGLSEAYAEKLERAIKEKLMDNLFGATA